MKRTILLLSLPLILTCAFASVKHFWRGTTLSQSETSKKWGQHPFEAARFKKGDEPTRASMAASILINKKRFIGKDVGDVRSELGDFTGFYFRDTFPTYIIHTATSKTDSSWQLVFLLDDDFKVADVIVHKNCCDLD